MNERNEYGFPIMPTYTVPMTEEQEVEAEYEAQAEAALFVAAEYDDE